MYHYNENYYDSDFQESFQIWFNKYVGERICKQLNEEYPYVKYKIENTIYGYQKKNCKEIKMPKEKVQDIVDLYYYFKIYNFMIEKSTAEQRKSLILYDNFKFFNQYIDVTISELVEEVSNDEINHNMLKVLIKAYKLDDDADEGKFKVNNVEFKVIKLR